MKKILSFSLAVLMLISALCLSACSDNGSNLPSTDISKESSVTGNTSLMPSSPSSPDSFEGSASCEVSPASSGNSKDSPASFVAPSSESPSGTSEPEKFEIPSSYSLKGTKHLPIVDDQGGIGSCTSEGITYAQFTVAVSQYVNHYYPEENWDPSSGNPQYIFSPKFSYNYTTGNTSMCYRILVDDGCLPMSVSSFEKYSSYPGFWGGSILNSEKTRSWDVSEGMMFQALKYRLTGFEELSAPSKITGDSDEAFINKVKTAIARGNVVTVCGAAYNWKYTKLPNQPDECLAKAGEAVMWRSGTVPRSGPSGHCVALVGYDDNVTLSVGGVEMKGAFLMMNSWGNWMNGGFVWVMYDACNESSDFEILNSSAFNGAPALGSKNDKFYRITDYLAEDYTLTFIPAGETDIFGETYPTYYIKNNQTGKYYSYKDGAFQSVTKTKLDENCEFALPSYHVLVENPDSEYRADEVITVYAVNGKDSAKYLNCSGIGTAPSLTGNLDEAQNVCFCLSVCGDKQEDGSFVGIVYTKYNFQPMNFKRERAFGDYGFVYWDENITVGNPLLSVEVKVETLNRKGLYMFLHRTDAEGNQEIYIPAMMQIRINESAVPETGGGSEKVSFSGVLSPSKRESGYFSFGYLPLASLVGDMKFEDYLWGVTVGGIGTIVEEIRLIDQQGKIIASVKPDTSVEPIVKYEKVHYAIQMGDQLKSSFGVGSFALTNKDTGKTMSLSKNNMTFDWVSDSLKNSDKCGFRFEYLEKDGAYRIWDYKDEYVWDIYGSVIKEGAMVKLNKDTDRRNTQRWLIDEKDGLLKISLKADPSYALNYKDGQFCISAFSKEEGYIWSYGPYQTINMPISVKPEGDNVVLTLKKPEKYTDGPVQIRISADGKAVDTVEAVPTDEGTRIELTLEKGHTYLFSAFYNGMFNGLQIAYEVK